MVVFWCVVESVGVVGGGDVCCLPIERKTGLRMCVCCCCCILFFFGGEFCVWCVSRVTFTCLRFVYACV